MGLGLGKIDSIYEISDTTLTDKANTFVLTLGYMSQFDSGFGITLDTKYYFPDNESVDYIISLELGLRFSF